MNRVGRFNDQCVRIKLGDFPDVDVELSMAVWAELLSTREKGRKGREKFKVPQTKALNQNKREAKAAVKDEHQMIKLEKEAKE